MSLTFINKIIEIKSYPNETLKKKKKDFFSPLNRFVVYNSLKVNVNLPRVGSK